jgi:hypothetical protein
MTIRHDVQNQSMAQYEREAYHLENIPGGFHTCMTCLINKYKQLQKSKKVLLAYHNKMLNISYLTGLI